MRMQIYRMTITRMLSAFLTGVIIAFKYLLAPFNVFTFTSGNSVLMGFVYVVFPFCLIGLLSLFACGWMNKFSTSLGAYFSNPATFSVSWHQMTTNRAMNFYRQTIRTYLILPINILSALFANLTSFTDAVGICLQVRSASNTGWIFAGLSHNGNLGGWFSALWARLARCQLTRCTDAKLSAILMTNNAQVFSHVSIIP